MLGSGATKRVPLLPGLWLLLSGSALAEQPVQPSAPAPIAPATPAAPVAQPGGAPAQPPAEPPLAQPAPAGSPPPVTQYAGQPAPVQHAGPGQARPNPQYYAPPSGPPIKDPTARTHDGFYLRMGLGGGYGQVTTDHPIGQITYSGGGLLLDLLLGATISNVVTIGGGVVTMHLSDPELTLNGQEGSGFETEGSLGVATLGPFVDVFLGPHSGGHLGTVIGTGSIGLEDESGDFSNGLGFAFFGGYDWWVSDQWALGLNARYLRVRGERDLGEVGTVTDTADTFGVMFSALYH